VTTTIDMDDELTYSGTEQQLRQLALTRFPSLSLSSFFPVFSPFLSFAHQPVSEGVKTLGRVSMTEGCRSSEMAFKLSRTKHGSN